MKSKLFRKKQKGIAERKTESTSRKEVPFKALAMGVLLWLFVTWLFFGSGIVRHIDLGEGQRIPSTITAEVDFECENLTETSFNRTKAASAVPPVFTISDAPAQRANEVIEKLFDRLLQLTTAATNQHHVIINSMEDLLLGSSVRAAELIEIFPSNTIASTQFILSTNITQVMSAGILSDETRQTLFRDAPDRKLTLTDAEGNTPKTVSQRNVYSTRRALEAISDNIDKNKQRELAERLLATLVVKNMTYNEAATEALRTSAMDNVAPVMQQYLSGTTLVRAGESATQQTLLLLQLHEQQRQNEQEVFEQILEVVGNGILLLAGLIACGVILRVVAP